MTRRAGADPYAAMTDAQVLEISPNSGLAIYCDASSQVSKYFPQPRPG